MPNTIRNRAPQSSRDYSPTSSQKQSPDPKTPSCMRKMKSPPPPPPDKKLQNLIKDEQISEISFNPNAVSNPSYIDGKLRSIETGPPPKVPPRPKHLNKKYGMLSYLTTPKISNEYFKLPQKISNTSSKGLTRSESLPSFLCRKNALSSKEPEQAKYPVIKVRKISFLLVPNESSTISKVLNDTQNSVTTGFSRELRKVKSTLTLAKNHPLFIRRTEEQPTNNKINENKNEEFKHEISIEIVDSDSNPSNSNRNSSDLDNYTLIQKRQTSLPIKSVSEKCKMILRRSISAPDSFMASQNIVENDEFEFSIPETPHRSFVLRNKKRKHFGFGDSIDEAHLDTEEHDLEGSKIPIFVTTYNSSDEDDVMDHPSETPPTENTKKEDNKLPTETVPTASFKTLTHTLKRKLSVENNKPLNISSPTSLYNISKKLSIIHAPSSPRPPRKNLNLQTSSSNSLHVPQDVNQTRLRKAAMFVKTANSVSSLVAQEHSIRCERCKQEARDLNIQRNKDRQYDKEGNLTVLGRCWHRLHVSKARLNATSTTSELFAAFAMVALVEMQINMPCTVPDICWILFAMNTTMIVGVNILALMISTFILPNINAVTRLHPTALIAESPHDTMRWFIEVAWGFSTFLNLLLSIVNIALISWVKFWDLGVAGAITSTAIVVPSLVAFIILAIHFYRIVESTEVTVATESSPGHETTNQHPAGVDNPGFVQDEVSIDIIHMRGEEDADTLKDNNIDGSLTPRGLQWRSLHVSLAKLEATSSASELMSGFATMAAVELQTNSPTAIPSWMFVLLAINSTVLVLLNVFALMISTFILPSVEAITHQHGSNLVHNSPHQHLRWYIEVAWVFSTVLGMFVFLFEVIILSWTKFWDFSFDGAAASTGIILLSMVIFIGFTAYFYYTLVDHKCETTDMDLKYLENMKQKLDDELALQNAMNDKHLSNVPDYYFDERFTGERLV